MRLLCALVALAGCVTARASLGSHTSTGGTRGFDAAGGFGLGWSWRGHQAIYASADGGVASDGHVRAVVADRVEYVSHASVPYLVGFRFGMRLPRQKYDLPGQPFAGVGFAIFPFHTTPRPHEDDHSDDSWAEAPILPDIDSWDELGFELDTDAVEGQGTVFTVSVVIATDTMLAR